MYAEMQMLPDEILTTKNAPDLTPAQAAKERQEWFRKEAERRADGGGMVRESNEANDAIGGTIISSTGPAGDP